MTQSVLVVAAHPDDEALGAAGTIARHCQKGDRVRIVFMADGEGARTGGDAEARRSATLGAAEAMGVAKRDILFLDFPDNQMDTIPLLEITRALERVLTPHAPEVIYTHHGGDLNIDHRVTHHAVLTALRPLPGNKASAIYAFEVPSSTEWAPATYAQHFAPQHYVDISAHWKNKLKALECYENEMRAFPHPRSYEAVEALARLRGAQVGRSMAEAFCVIRQIVG